MNLNIKNFSATVLLIIFFISSVGITSVKSQQNNTYTAYGPIGTGPYIYMGTDPETGAVKLVRNDNYWNKEALQNAGSFEIQEFDLQYINGSHAAIEALTAGNVSIISPYYRINNLSAVSSLGLDYVAVYAGAVFQMNLNNRHPTFGTGKDTPLGQADTSRAAEAARYVRQAISHLIPREEIIDAAFSGAATQGVITGLCPTSVGYDETLEPYSCNLTLAKQLLTQAGYNTTSNNTLFHITLIAATGADTTSVTANLIQSNLNSVGIATDIEVMDFDKILDRLYPELAESVGKSYDQGGFDAAFITYTYGKDYNPYYSYDSSQFPPDGSNCNLWNNTENDQLCRLIKDTANETERVEYLKQWQQLFYNEQPAIAIAYPKESLVFNSSILEKTPFEIYYPSAWPVAENWVLNQSTTQTKIVMAVLNRLPLEGFNPYKTSGNDYDYDVIHEVFESLATMNDSITHAIIPALATSWESSADNTSWTVHLRENVTWHDGAPFTATDVKFTYDTAINEVGSAWLTDIIGSSDNVVVIDAYTIKFSLINATSDFADAVLTYSIIPAHILQGVAYEDWGTHPFNTAANSYVITFPQATTSPTATATTYPTNNLEQNSIYIIAAAIVVIIIVAATVAAIILRKRK